MSRFFGSQGKNSTFGAAKEITEDQMRVLRKQAQGVVMLDCDTNQALSKRAHYDLLKKYLVLPKFTSRAISQDYLNYMSLIEQAFKFSHQEWADWCKRAPSLQPPFDPDKALKRTVPQTLVALMNHPKLKQRNQMMVFEAGRMPDDLYCKQLRYFIDPNDELHLLNNKIQKSDAELPKLSEGLKLLKG